MRVTCDGRAGNENATGKVTCDGDGRRECLFHGKATGMVSCDRDSHFVTGMGRECDGKGSCSLMEVRQEASVCSCMKCVCVNHTYPIPCSSRSQAGS